jgi:hypothetical protein
MLAASPVDNPERDGQRVGRTGQVMPFQGCGILGITGTQRAMKPIQGGHVSFLRVVDAGKERERPVEDQAAQLLFGKFANRLVSDVQRRGGDGGGFDERGQMAEGILAEVVR